jgi:hypothetical protein
MKSKKLILLLVLALFLVVAGMTMAKGVVELPRWAMGSGATDSAAGDLSLRATLGQPLVGSVSGGDVTLGQGFWHGGELPVGQNDMYLPLVQG